MAFQIRTGLYMQAVLDKSLPDLSEEDNALVHQFTEIRLPLLTELMQLPFATPNFDSSSTNQGAIGWSMLTTKHELLLEQYLDKLEANVHIVTHNDKHKTIALHIVKAETTALLAKGISLDVIGWFFFTIQHWTHELARREAEKKIKAQFPIGHVVTRAERIAAINRFDDEERRDTGTRETLYDLRLLRTREEVVKMGKMCGQKMLEGWLSLITNEAAMGLFPGTADTTNYAKSKELAIKWLEEDLSNSDYFAETFAIHPDFVKAFYQKFLTVLTEDDPAAGFKIDIEDKEVAELLRSGTTPEQRQNMTPKEQEELVLRPIMEKLKAFQTQEQAADLGKRVGEVYVGIYNVRGILFVKMLDSGPTVFNPETSRRNSAKQCDEYIKRTYELAKKYDVAVDFVRAFFKGEKEVWLAATPTPTAEVDPEDMYQNRDGFWISASDQERANILNRCQAATKYAPRDQQTPIYIESMKEMVAYSLVNDPSYGFFLKGYFASSRVALMKSVREGTHPLAENLLVWRTYGEVEDKVKRDFAVKIGSAGGAATAADAGEVDGASDEVDDLTAGVELLDATKDNANAGHGTEN